ncbi:hypothetical protein CSA_011808, partial [Cucumis sativus]
GDAAARRLLRTEEKKTVGSSRRTGGRRRGAAVGHERKEKDGWGGCCANGEKGKETVETVAAAVRLYRRRANLDRAAAEGQRRGLAVQIWTAADLDAYGCFAN